MKKKYYIVIASSLGLCGGYNANVFEEIKGAIKPKVKIMFTRVGSQRQQVISVERHQGRNRVAEFAAFKYNISF